MTDLEYAAELEKVSDQFRSLLDQFKLQKNSNSTKPILLEDHDRRRIESALGRNFSDAESLVLAVEHAGQFQLDNLWIHLSPKLIERLQSRAIGIPFEKYLTQVITRRLEEEAGMR